MGVCRARGLVAGRFLEEYRESAGRIPDPASNNSGRRGSSNSSGISSGSGRRSSRRGAESAASAGAAAGAAAAREAIEATAETAAATTAAGAASAAAATADASATEVAAAVAAATTTAAPGPSPAVTQSLYGVLDAITQNQHVSCTNQILLVPVLGGGCGGWGSFAWPPHSWHFAFRDVWSCPLGHRVLGVFWAPWVY